MSAPRLRLVSSNASAISKPETPSLSMRCKTSRQERSQPSALATAEAQLMWLHTHRPNVAAVIDELIRRSVARAQAEQANEG
jgi:hypothetical protein